MIKKTSYVQFISIKFVLCRISSLLFHSNILQGMVDTNGYEAINYYAHLTKAAVDAGDFYEATILWGNTEYVILDVTGGIDFYNILYKIPYDGKRQEKIGNISKTQFLNFILFLIQYCALSMK